VEKQAELVSGVNTVAGNTADYASFALVALGSDPSGSMMKLSQMNKLTSRFRFINM